MDRGTLTGVSVRFLPALFLLIGPLATDVLAQTTSQVDEREWRFEDYRAVEEQDGDIVRPYRRQRNLMYALQDALNRHGFDAGGRWIIWGQGGSDPFRDALRRYQREKGFEPTGEIEPALVESLLGVNPDKPTAR